MRSCRSYGYKRRDRVVYDTEASGMNSTSIAKLGHAIHYFGCDNPTTVANGFLVVESDYILDLMEREIGHTHSVTERIDFYLRTDLSPEMVWRWAQRGSSSQEFAAIVNALGWMKHLALVARSESANAHSKRQLGLAELQLMQAVHYNKRVREFHLCKLSFADACRFNVELAWSTIHGDVAPEQDDSAVEDVRYLFE